MLSTAAIKAPSIVDREQRARLSGYYAVGRRDRLVAICERLRDDYIELNLPRCGEAREQHDRHDATDLNHGEGRQRAGLADRSALYGHVGRTEAVCVEFHGLAGFC